MKAAFGIAFLSLALVALTACASMEPRSEASAPRATPLTAEEVYVARVEQIARRRGISVTWVHKPSFGTKAKSSDQE